MGVKRYLRNQWDRVGAWVCIAAGAIALLVGYLGVSGTLVTGEQIPYVVSGGMVGLFLLGVGALLWLSADLRDEWRKLDAIDRQLQGEGAPSGTEGAAGNGAEPNRAQAEPREISLRT